MSNVSSQNSFTATLSQFIKLEDAGGIILLFVLATALVIANSPLESLYESIIDIPIQIRIGAFEIHKPILLWVNDGLMAIFFMLLALEIKREFAEGELREVSQLSLPLLGAIGGILASGAIYYFINSGDPSLQNGWPIPTTTDIAFMLGVVALLGRRVPTSLKAMLVALSIVDDVLVIAIIATISNAKLSWFALMLGGLGVIILIALNYFKVKRIAAYMLVAIFIWCCVLKSGIHATLAGVVVGLLIPLKGDENYESPLKRLEHSLHPWVAYAILPLFVFMNGGIPFEGFSIGQIMTAVPLGVALGLFVGKALGAFTGCSLAVILGLGSLPNGVNWRQLFGACALTGIGFTMSLFLTAMIFNQTAHENLARQGVLIGSLFACILGVSVFLLGKTHKD